MFDIKMKNDGDLDISSGDVRWIEPTYQHQYDLLKAGQGHYRESPLSGIDAEKYIQDTDKSIFLRAVRKQFSRDGMKLSYLDWKDGELIVEGKYEND